MNENDNTKADAHQDIKEIKDLLDQGLLSALTVDTSIFDEKGKRLTKGMFTQLTQFGKHPADLIFSDVVIMEMKRHLTEKLKAVKEKFSPTLIEAWESLGMDRAKIQELFTHLQQALNLEKLCDDQFENFIAESAAIVLKAQDFVSIEYLLQMYFGKKPPFDEGNPKKSEFPDAIALQTLESWASQSDRNLLVVSKDGDWKNFCQKSSRLYFVNDLATALELFQTPDNVVSSMLRRVHEELQANDQSLHSALTEFIENIEWPEFIRVEAYSQFELEEQGIEVLGIRSIEFPVNLEDIKLTEREDESISITFSTGVHLNLEANFSFKKWDGIDRMYLNMGSGRIETEVYAYLDIILILPIANGAFNDIQMDAEIETIDLLIGEVEPDWMSSANSEEM